jgi:hypothetical protein
MNADGSYKMTRWSNADVLNHLFKQGKPSNDLESAGLMVHCFDDTEGFEQPWTPCNSGFCRKSSQWWSGSIINQKLRSVFGDSGLIMTPSKVELLCSYDADSGTLYNGCAGKGPEFHGPQDTEGMLLQHVGRGGGGYNEVVINSKRFVEELPKSVAGIVFGLKSGSGGKTFEKIRAVRTYVMMLDRYNLSESAFPLLRANYDVTDFSGKTNVHGPAFVDESSKAREFLKKHPYIPALDKWNRQHPYLRGHPELTHEWMRKQNELEQAMLDRERTRRQTKTKTNRAALTPEEAQEAQGEAAETNPAHGQLPHQKKPLTKEWRPWGQQEAGPFSEGGVQDDGSTRQPNTWEWRHRNEDSETHDSERGRGKPA